MDRRKLKNAMNRWLGWFPLYRGLVGGSMYFNHRHSRYRPEDFRKCGKNVHISEEVEITSPGNMVIGDGAFIARGTLIGALGGVHIGNYSGIGAYGMIFSVEHRYIGAESIPFDDVRIIKPVWIEDYVFIGNRVSILPGVRIGEGSIVGLGSVVTKDVSPLKIVMGNPAQVIGSRDRIAFERLKAEGKFREPGRSAEFFWIPPYVQKKYNEELSVLGFSREEFGKIFRDPRYSE